MKEEEGKKEEEVMVVVEEEYLREYVAEGHIHDVLLQCLKVHLTCNTINIH